MHLGLSLTSTELWLPQLVPCIHNFLRLHSSNLYTVRTKEFNEMFGKCAATTDGHRKLD